ncbi:MAG: ABC transporter permease, partial [Betaproteobacteria bacterium]|nr:ABC transporter permease [Betaproteobacteria bacterium]
MFATIFTVMKKELRDHLRDRRTVLMILLLSVAMGPTMLVLMSQFFSSIEEKAEKREAYVLGIENAPSFANYCARQNYTLKVPEANYRALIKDGKHDAVLIIPKDFSERLLNGNAEMELVYDDTRSDTSSATIGVLRRLVQGFNGEITTQRLIARGVSPQVLRPVEVQNINLGTPAQRAVMILFIIPMMALLTGVSGCTAVAIDVTAGERERGSLEPLLLNPVSRNAIVLGKWLAVACYGASVVVLLLLGFGFTLTFLPLPKLTAIVSLSAAQFAAFGVTLISFSPAMGALQMLIATYGRSFKEAQTYVSYLIMVVSFVPVLPMLTQLKEATWQLMVPVLGQQMVLTRILRGEPMTALHYLAPLAVNVLICVVALSAIGQLLK